MECGCLRSKQFGAIDGTPVAPTEGTSAPHWLENSTELLAIKLKKCVT